MKTKILLLLLFAVTITGCKSSKDGCAGSKYQGQRFKAKKFDWNKM